MVRFNLWSGTIILQLVQRSEESHKDINQRTKRNLKDHIIYFSIRYRTLSSKNPNGFASNCFINIIQFVDFRQLKTLGAIMHLVFKLKLTLL